MVGIRKYINFFSSVDHDHTTTDAGSCWNKTKPSLIETGRRQSKSLRIAKECPSLQCPHQLSTNIFELGHSIWIHQIAEPKK
jgi:hypothetical protein